MTDYGTPGTATPAATEESPPSAADRAWDVAGTAASQAGGVASTALEQTKSVAGTTVDQTRVVADDAKQHARRLGRDATAQLRGQVDEQTTRVARSLGDVGQQLRTMAEKADDPESPVTTITRQAADGVDRLAGRLDDGGLDQIVDDVKRFARNRPGLFLAGALGAGFVIGRLIKAVDLGEVMKGEGGSDSSVQPMLDSSSDWDDSAGSPGFPESDPYASLATGGTPGPGSEDTGFEGFQSDATAAPTTPTPASYPSTPPVAPAEDVWGQR